MRQIFYSLLTVELEIQAYFVWHKHINIKSSSFLNINKKKKQKIKPAFYNWICYTCCPFFFRNGWIITWLFFVSNFSDNNFFCCMCWCNQVVKLFWRINILTETEIQWNVKFLLWYIRTLYFKRNNIRHTESHTRTKKV